MALGSFVHDALADLTSEDLGRMLELDETLFVEHKAGIGEETAHGLMKAIGSFANTLGGWLLLGVKGGRPLQETPDWAQPDAPPLVDFVRDRLRLELDPLPAFEARVLSLPDGMPVGIVRIYESADTPHVAIRSGAVYVREVAGDRDATRPRRSGSGSHGERAYRAVQIRSREQLLELAERGRRAAQRVDDLLDPQTRLPLLRNHLPFDLELLRGEQLQPPPGSSPAIVVRLAPLTLSPRFRAWATTADSSSALLASIETMGAPSGLNANWLEPDPSGAAIAVPLTTAPVHADATGFALDSTAHMVLDAAGVAGAAYSLSAPEHGRRRGWVQLSHLAGLISRLITAAADLLCAGEFLGRARCQIDLVRLSQVFLFEGSDGEGGRPWVPASSDIALPAEQQQVEAVAQRAANALWRGAGVAAWDSSGR